MRFENTNNCQQFASMPENHTTTMDQHIQHSVYMKNFLNRNSSDKVPIAAEEVQWENPSIKTSATYTACLDADAIYDHYEPTVRLLRIRKSITGSCGFHLTRTKWDPYPWVSAIDAHTAAEMSGLKAGDCVLEVNGEDVLGLRITDIAKLVQAKSGHVTLLLWNCGSDFKCDPESIGCAPMPRTLQRLATIVQSVLTIIECPVCTDTITPPAMQCQNGHLLCLNCRILAEKCPICRDRYTPQRALIAEQIYAAITNAYNLCSTNEDKLRQKLFGWGEREIGGGNVMSRRRRRAEAAKQTIDDEHLKGVELEAMQAQKRLSRRLRTKGEQCQSQYVAPGGGQPGRFRFRKEADAAKAAMGRQIIVTDVNTEASVTKRDGHRKKKIVMKLWHGKAASMENLSTSAIAKVRTTKSDELSAKVMTTSSGDNGLALDGTTTHSTLQLSSNRSVSNDSDELKRMVMKHSKDHSTWSGNNSGGTHYNEEVATTAATIIKITETAATSHVRTMAMPLSCATTMKTILNSTTANDVVHVNAMSKLLSATTTTPTTPTTNGLSAMSQRYLSLPFPQQQAACKDNNPEKEVEVEVEVEEEEEEENEGEEVEKMGGNAQKQQQKQHLQFSTGQHQQYVTEHTNNTNNHSDSIATTPAVLPTTLTPNPTIAIERCSLWQRRQRLTQSNFNDYNSNNNKNNNINCENCSCPSSLLLFVDKRRPASQTMNHSNEYFNKCYWPTATASSPLPFADLKKHSDSNSIESRKSSISSACGNCNEGGSSSSGIVDSSHSILTPASSLSSGVFFSSLEPNDFYTTMVERCNNGKQQQGTEITAIMANKNAVLSPMVSLGQPSSITSSLRSLSSLASSTFSSTS